MTVGEFFKIVSEQKINTGERGVWNIVISDAPVALNEMKFEEKNALYGIPDYFADDVQFLPTLPWIKWFDLFRLKVCETRDTFFEN